MPNGSQIGVTAPEAKALKRYLDGRLKSVDETVKELGQADAFKLHNLHDKINRKVEKLEEKESE